MSDMPLPEPTEKDEELALEFIRIKDETNLRGTPLSGEASPTQSGEASPTQSGEASPTQSEQRCDNCHFYADTDKPIAYCWHDELEIMVGGSWWCDRWEEIGAPDQQASQEDRTTAMKLHFDKVEDQQWLDHPKFGEQCNSCLYYLNPDESVSYCWHPKLQIGVGADHWCQWWEEIPGEV